MTTMTLELDDDDFATIQNAIARYQVASRKIAPNEPTIVPEGESNLAGAIIAECIRDLEDYRILWQLEN